jgi:hypothetical protein
MDVSPYYENENYLEDKDLIDLPPLIPEELLNDPSKQKQTFNLSTQVRASDQSSS